MAQIDTNVDASPTKSLFISMLVKDIGLIRSIVDLVDNSVDGAKKSRDDENYDGLWVLIETSSEHLKISDNCGGIPLDIARNYAFRFGRATSAPKTQHSVGQFGVGMKRALFKLGRWFRIRSTTQESGFTLEVDVDEWSRDEQNWNFQLTDVQDQLDNVPEDQQGTTIEVRNLNEGVKSSFELENFLNRLRRELEQAHVDSMDKGISITLNSIPLRAEPLKFLDSEELKPVRIEQTYGDSENPIHVKLYAGVSESSPAEAGWYVFCNGRLVLGQDKSHITGWGETDKETIPRFHNQFTRFRGYAFFDCDDASLLPWNTTKTGVDTDSPLFQKVRLEMIQATRPVIDFLNKLDAEKDREEEEAHLEEAVSKASIRNLSDVTYAERSFQAPSSATKRQSPSTGNISYRKTNDEIDKVKNILGIRTNREVGERTFEYFVDIELDED